MKHSLVLSRRHATCALATGALFILAATGSSPVSSARAAGFASFPETLSPVQISRNLTMQQAARAGMLKLTAKGGYEGDSVKAELEGKKLKGPISVAVHVEFAFPPGHSEFSNQSLNDELPRLERQTEKELNKRSNKTKNGEPITFDLDFRYRRPSDPPSPGYDQITVIDPKVDQSPPSFPVGAPNSGQVVDGTIPIANLFDGGLANGVLGFVGLTTQFIDFYVDGGRRIPLPKYDMNQAELAAYLKTVKPPVSDPSTKNVRPMDVPGTERCDIMGTGSGLACRRISKNDLKWIELQAGVQVEANPGELMLNKSGESQNLAVDYPTRIFAPRGGKTVAPGISTYCVDHTKGAPGIYQLLGSSEPGEGFDVGPALSALPDFSGVVKLLELNAELQPSLDAPVEGMQQAIWNLTDGTPLAEEPAVQAAAGALLAKASLAEDSTPGGLAHPADPNAGAPTTGAVDPTGAILSPIPAEEAAPPPAIRAGTVALVPNKVPSGRAARPFLVLGVEGEASGVALELERQKGHKWKSIKSLPGLSLHSGQTELPLKLGKLKAGKYRVQVTLSGPTGPPVVGTASLTVGGRKK